MSHQRRLASLALAGLAACAPQPPAPPSTPPPAAAAVALVRPATLEDYKRRLAGRIVSVSTRVFHEPLPEMMKSIVVLHIRIDARGQPLDVSVFRSNGFSALEKRALASVAAAVPLPPPPAALLDDAGSLSFLETFLFRDDDLFQVRSLVQ
jgi:periplasmic protein TonB